MEKKSQIENGSPQTKPIGALNDSEKVRSMKSGDREYHSGRKNPLLANFKSDLTRTKEK